MTQNIRNVAVIAHVDHGKTTIIDALLKQTHVFRDNQKEMQESTILDSNDQERERGITILAKNCAIEYEGTQINIIDTPGHADFSGEVERTLGMADGALLIVDAAEGPMPQTRFVLKKALELGLKIILVVNKIDKQFSKPQSAINKTGDLFLELASSEDQLEFPTLFAIGREGKVFDSLPEDPNQPGDTRPLLEAIVKHIPAPSNDETKPFKMVVSSLDYNTHLGRIAIGKIHQGKLSLGQKVVLSHQPDKSFSITKLFTSKGLDRIEVESASAGQIVALAGLDNISIGQTLADPADTTPLDAPAISEPTLDIELGPNTSPFAGREGEFTTSRQLEARLTRELETNLSLRMEKLPSGRFKLSGKGELHLSVLFETLRREGYEMEVSKPQVIVKDIDGQKSEPVEEAVILVPNEFSGVINQELGKRYAKMLKMEPLNDGEIEFTYQIPTRAIIGLRSLLLTQTKGTAIFSSQMTGWQPVGRDLAKMRTGVLIASETGESLAYGLQGAQNRGSTFVAPGTKVYEGMIIGQNAKDEDIEINICRGKKLTNMRASAADAIVQLVPPVELSLEQALDFLESDELLEITPQNLRLRKRYLTDIERRRHRRS
jgi:GTP-binding protein